MADQENIDNARRQNEMFDAQVSTLEALNRLAQQRVVFEGQVADEISNENDILREQLKIANLQKDGTLKNLSQQRELNKVNNQTLGIARSIQSVTASELGSQKLIEKVQKDRLKVQKNIDFLQKAAQQTYSQDKELNQAIQNSILAQVDASQKLVTELNTVESTSKAIANDGFLSIFDTLKKIINVIPGLRELLPGFDQAAESYREALVLQESLGAKGIGGKKGEKIQGLGVDQAGSLNDKIKAYRAGDKEGTKGMSKDFIKDLPKELQDTLKGTTGTASLAILSNKFKDGVATAVSPLSAAFTALQKFLKNFILLQFLTAMVKADKVAGDLAKSMNVTYQEGVQIQDNLNSIANTTNSIFVTSEKLAETQMFFNKELGTTVMLTDEQLTTMTKLREAAGFTNEELAGIAKISITTGNEMETITGEVLAQAKISSTRLGVVLNERDVIKEISKVSAATTLSLGKSGEAIADAVATAKSLGLELSKVEAISSSILQFESSIEDELSAELLIGKELNLDRARFAALNNDVATVAKEISSQIGTAAEFGKMNRIEQEALAKAVGMNREELAQTLYVQEQLAGVSGEEAKKREKILNDRIAEVGLAQAQQEMAEEGFETLENQASVTEQLTALTEKLNEVFVAIAPAVLVIADAIMLVLKPISFIVGLVSQLGKMFGGIPATIGLMIPLLMKAKLISKGFALNGFKGAAAAIYKTFAAIPYGLGLPLAIAGVAGLGAVVNGASKMFTADDLMSSPTGGSGYGDRILLGKEGAYAFNNRDTIQASTQGSPTQQSTSVVETKLYIDNEAFAQASSKSFSKL